MRAPEYGIREDDPDVHRSVHPATRRRHGEAQREDGAPGGTDLGTVRHRRPAADRVHQLVRRTALAVRGGPQLPAAAGSDPVRPPDRQAQPGRSHGGRGTPAVRTPALPSYSSGTSTVALLGDT